MHIYETKPKSTFKLPVLFLCNITKKFWKVFICFFPRDVLRIKYFFILLGNAYLWLKAKKLESFILYWSFAPLP